MKNAAITTVTIEALKGSSEAPFPAESKPLTFCEGNILSRAIACKVRGATIIEPSAEEIVAAANPKGIIHQPCHAMWLICNCVVSAKASGLAETANFHAIKR